MKKEKSISNKIFLSVVCIVLILYTITIFIPLIWGMMTSLKSHYDFTIFGNKIGFPNLDAKEFGNSVNEFFRLANYAEVLQKATIHAEASFYVGNTLKTNMSDNGIGMLLVNTLLQSGLGALLQAIVPAIMAYAVAKYRFAYSKIVYAVVVFVMIMPVVGNQPAEITMLRKLGLYDTYWGFLLQKFNFVGMYFLVYYAFYDNFSNAYLEAAEIDGASQFMQLTKIVLPLSVKLISSVFVIQFVHFWNDYNTSFLYMPTKTTLAYAVWFWNTNNQTLKSTVTRVASSMLLAVPILVMFVIFRDKLMGNMTMGGLKQ